MFSLKEIDLVFLLKFILKHDSKKIIFYLPTDPYLICLGRGRGNKEYFMSGLTGFPLLLTKKYPIPD